MSRNENLVRGANLDALKMEVAAELGMGYDKVTDRGELTSRQNGAVGGHMVRRMVAAAEEALARESAPDAFHQK